MAQRINRNFRSLLQEGGSAEVLSICEKAGEQLQLANAVGALQALARAEDPSAPASADERFAKLMDATMDLLTAGTAGGVSKELAVTAWALAKLQCGSHLEVLVPLVCTQAPVFSPDELASTVWAFAKLEMLHWPLLHAISAAARARLSEFAPRDLSTSSWSFAKLLVEDKPLISAISAAALARLSEFGSLDLVNTAWSFSELGFLDGRLHDAVWARAAHGADDYAPHEVANIAWSVARCSLASDELVMDSIAVATSPGAADFAPRDLTTTAWSCAKLRFDHQPLQDAIASQALAMISAYGPQELANTVWAFARRCIEHRPLLSAIASASLRKLDDYQTGELTMTAWSFATLRVVDLPLLEAISAASIPRMTEFTVQDIATTAWSFSTLALMDDELIDAIAGAASRRLTALSPKELAITVWSMATILVADDDRLALLDAVAARMVTAISEFGPQDLSYTAWAFAKLSLWHKTLLGSIAALSPALAAEFAPAHLRSAAWRPASAPARSARPTGTVLAEVLRKSAEFYDQQHIANTVWAFAKLQIADHPLMDALASAARPPISEFTPQGLSNTSWAYAKLLLEACPLLDAIAAEALNQLPEFSVQSFASIAWSLATIQLRHQPFMEAIASAARRTIDVADAQGFGGPNVQSLLWSLWKAERSDLAQAVCRSWLGGSRVPCVLELGLLIMEGAWQKDASAEPRLLVRLVEALPVRLMRIALWKIAMVPAAAKPAEAPALPLHDALGLSEQECRRYMKLARFVQYLECSGTGGSPEDVIEAVEWFPKIAGRWLKVAGGDKAVVLWDALRSRPNAAHEVAVEFGALVGYTTVRLGALCSRVPRSDPARARAGCTNVISVELDVCHACVARYAVDLAGLSGSVEIWLGQVHDVIPRVLEEFGARSLCYLFMDQKGTSFHDDLQQLELIGAMGVEGRVLADNCLKPGAPFFVWHVSTSPIYSTTIWAMPEFASEEIEDWMVVCRYAAMPQGSPPECPPRARRILSQLAWETDNMRTGAERGGLHVDDWVAFSQYVLRCFARLGIEARPWVGLPEPPGGYPRDMPLDNVRLAERYEVAIQAEEDSAALVEEQ